MIFASFESFTAMMFQVQVFWVMTSYSVVVGWYQRFKGPCCENGPLQRWYPTTTLHGVTTQKTSTWLIILLPHIKKLLESINKNIQREVWSSKYYKWKFLKSIKSGKLSLIFKSVTWWMIFHFFFRNRTWHHFPSPVYDEYNKKQVLRCSGCLFRFVLGRFSFSILARRRVILGLSWFSLVSPDIGPYQLLPHPYSSFSVPCVRK